MLVEDAKDARESAPESKRTSQRRRLEGSVEGEGQTHAQKGRPMGFAGTPNAGKTPTSVKQEFMPPLGQGYTGLSGPGNGNGSMTNNNGMLSTMNTGYSNGLTPSYSGMSAFDGLENIENVDAPGKLCQQMPTLPGNNTGLMFTSSAPKFSMDELELMLNMPPSQDNQHAGRTSKDYGLVRKAPAEASPPESAAGTTRTNDMKPPLQKKTKLVDYRTLPPPSEPVQVKNSWRAFQEKESYLRCLKRMVDPGKSMKLGGLQNSKDLRRWVEALFGEQPEFEVWEQLNRPKDFWKRPDSLLICLAEFGSWVSRCTGVNKKITPDDTFIKRQGSHHKVKTGQSPAQEKASLESSLGIRLKEIRFPLTESNLWKNSIKGAEKKKAVVGIGPDPKTTRVLADSHNKLYYLLDTKSNQLIGGPYQAATQASDAWKI
eukprot:scaffold285_cov330-Pavlova_lutheri.AAC.138